MQAKNKKNNTKVTVVNPEAIEPVEKKGEVEIMIPDTKSLMLFAEGLFKSGMFPGIKNAYQAMATIEYGRELGIKPIIAMQTIVPVRGKLCVESKVLQAILEEKGVKITIIKKNDKGSEIRFERAGKDPHVETFTIEDAKKKGFLKKDNWILYPEEMCYYRCISKGGRAYYPGAILGLYSKEEILDVVPFEEEKKKTKVKVTASGKKDKEEPEKKEEEAPQPVKALSPAELPEPPDDFEPAAEGEIPLAKEKEDRILLIKRVLEQRKIPEKKFKLFLGEILGPRKDDRMFVAKNQYGHWSFNSGKNEDQRLMGENFEWALKQYNKYNDENPGWEDQYEMPKEGEEQEPF